MRSDCEDFLAGVSRIAAHLQKWDISLRFKNKRCNLISAAFTVTFFNYIMSCYQFFMPSVDKRCRFGYFLTAIDFLLKKQDVRADCNIDDRAACAQRITWAAFGEAEFIQSILRLTSAFLR